MPLVCVGPASSINLCYEPNNAQTSKRVGNNFASAV